MGGIVSILISILAAILLYGTGHAILFTAAIVIALLTFWSVGVMHNYASYARRARAARLRENLALEGRLDTDAEIRLQEYERGTEPHAIPNWLAVASMLLTAAAVVLLITSFFLR